MARLIGRAAIGLLVAAAHPALAQPEAPPTFTNLALETCQLTQRNTIIGDPAAPPPAFLTCGKASHPSGAVTLLPLPLALPSDPAERRLALEKVTAASPARREASSRMACRQGQWIGIDDQQQIFAEPCSLVDGDWAYVQLLLEARGYLVQIEGLPVNVSALLAAADRLSGGLAAAPALTSPDQVKALLGKIFAGKAPLVSSAELDHFAELTDNARLANGQRDYHAAEDYYRQALLILERAQSLDSPGVGKALMELALEVSNQGRTEESASLFRRADPIILRSPNPPEQARYTAYLAFDAANGGRYADALAYARNASGQWRDLAEGNGTNLESLGDDARGVWRGELAHSLNTQAAMALRTGDLAEAEAAAKEALDIIGENRNLPPWWRPEILTTLGRIQAALGRLTLAEESFRGALVYQQRLFGDTVPTAETLLALSGVYADEGLNEDSLRAYDFALKILSKDETARSQLPFDQIAPLLQAASVVADSQPSRRTELEAKMFDGLQRLSGGVADQTIAQASVRLAAQNPAMESLVRGLQEAERRRDTARIMLAHETSLPDEQRGAAKERALLAEITQQGAERDALLRKINADFPAYAQLSRPEPVALAEVQSRLRPGEAMVMFETGRAKSAVILVTAQRLIARPVSLDQGQIDSTVRSLRKAFASKSGRLGDFDLALSYSLYRALFGPIENELKGIDQLVLVQNGALASLPAALLVTAAPNDDSDYRRAAWLVRRFAANEVPSPRAFTALRDRTRISTTQGPSFLGIGNPTFVGDGGEAKGKSALATIDGVCRDGGPFPAEMLRSLAPLPDTATELRTVARALGANDDALLLGAAATESNFRKQNLADVRVLYFASHALLPGELSCQSEPALALSPPDSPATSRDQDGLLDASEVAGLSLNADLVVLSACNTGQSETKFGGQALSGLAESFFYAGARSLVASHWQVPSVATAKLMVGLFETLSRDPAAGTARALRQSQLALISQAETAHPFFWASFTIIGDSNAPRPAGSASVPVNQGP